MKRQSLILVCGIIVLSFFLRFFRIEETFLFSGEVGHNVLAIKDAIATHTVPFIGPPTSHPWLSFGPLFYWVYGPILRLSGFNPISHAYFGETISLLTVIANYIVISKIVNKRVGLLSSFLIGISPLFLEFGRAGRFFSIVTLLIYPFLFCLYKIWQGRKEYLFALGFIFGCMFSFHFTPLMLAPFMGTVLLLTNKKAGEQSWKASIRDMKKVLGGFVLPMAPFFIYDMLHGFSMTKNIALWIPYRIAGFVGLYPKNMVSTKVIQENVLSVYGFITKSFIVSDNRVYEVSIFVLFVIGCSILIRRYIFLLRRGKDRRERQESIGLFLLWFLWGAIALFIHGSPPIHYFVPLLPAPIIILSLFFDSLLKGEYGKYGRIGAGILLLAILSINARYYFSPRWFYLVNNHVIQEPYYVPYPLQQKVAQTIVRDAGGKRFVLHRVGQDDQFDGDYAQNYQYLLWWYGNEPDTSRYLAAPRKIMYTIYEGIAIRGIRPGDTIIRISNIYIVKSGLQ